MAQTPIRVPVYYFSWRKCWHHNFRNLDASSASSNRYSAPGVWGSILVTQGIVNLSGKTKDADELWGEQLSKSNEKWGGLWHYTTDVTPVTSFHCWNRSCKRARYSPACKRWRRGWKCPAIGPKAERKRWACLADLNRRIFFSCSRVGWCEFSARLLCLLCYRYSTPGRISHLAVP